MEPEDIDSESDEETRVAQEVFGDAIEQAESRSVPIGLFFVTAIAELLRQLFDPDTDGNPEALRKLVNDILDDLETEE